MQTSFSIESKAKKNKANTCCYNKKTKLFCYSKNNKTKKNVLLYAITQNIKKYKKKQTFVALGMTVKQQSEKATTFCYRAVPLTANNN